MLRSPRQRARRAARHSQGTENRLAETFISEWTAPKIAAVVVNQSTIRSWLDGWGNGIGATLSGGGRSLTDIRRIDRHIVAARGGVRCGGDRKSPTAPAPRASRTALPPRAAPTRRARRRFSCRVVPCLPASAWRRRAAVRAIDQIRGGEHAVARLPAHFLDAGRGVDGVAEEDDLLLYRTHFAGHHGTAMHPGAEIHCGAEFATVFGREPRQSSIAPKQAATQWACATPSSSLQVAINSSPT